MTAITSPVAAPPTPLPLPRNVVLTGDAHATLTRLPRASVDMVLTSPPYYRLRDYGVAGQLGTEATVADWVNGLREVTQELARVLVPTGSLWLNLGDSYAMTSGQGAARKSLLLGPERLTLALVNDGWILRNKIVWRKPNPMPSPVRDRLTCSYELIYLLVRSTSYYFDLDGIRQPHTTTPSSRTRPVTRTDGATAWRGSNAVPRSGLDALKAAGHVGHPLGKNPGDVWTFANADCAVSTGRRSLGAWQNRPSGPVAQPGAAPCAGRRGGNRYCAPAAAPPSAGR